MISFDFAYYRPGSLEEAVQAHRDSGRRGEKPLYLGGGTEFITRARLNRVTTGAVVDIKGVSECRVLDERAGQITFGAAVRLTRIRETGIFPLLSAVARHVADRTARNQITLGGDICGEIRYREAVLPFLLADGQVLLAGPGGQRRAPIRQAFDRRLLFQPGEFLVQVAAGKEYAALPYALIRRPRQGKTGYPVATVAALRAGNRMRVAFSGVAAFPFRSPEVEEELNRPGLSGEARVDRALEHLPAQIQDDMLASAGYRRFVVRNALLEVIEQLGV